MAKSKRDLSINILFIGNSLGNGSPEWISKYGSIVASVYEDDLVAECVSRVCMRQRGANR